MKIRLIVLFLIVGKIVASEPKNIHQAVSSLSENAVKVCIQEYRHKGIDPFSEQDLLTLMTPLHLAVKINSIAMVQCLLNASDINVATHAILRVKDINGNTVFDIAREYNNDEIITALRRQIYKTMVPQGHS